MNNRLSGHLRFEEAEKKYSDPSNPYKNDVIFQVRQLITTRCHTSSLMQCNATRPHSQLNKNRLVDSGQDAGSPNKPGAKVRYGIWQGMLLACC